MRFLGRHSTLLGSQGGANKPGQIATSVTPELHALHRPTKAAPRAAPRPVAMKVVLNPITAAHGPAAPLPHRRTRRAAPSTAAARARPLLLAPPRRRPSRQRQAAAHAAAMSHPQVTHVSGRGAGSGACAPRRPRAVAALEAAGGRCAAAPRAGQTHFVPPTCGATATRNRYSQSPVHL